MAGFAGGDFLGAALYAEGLSDMGEIQIMVQCCAGPDLPDFQAAVCLIAAGVVRGEKR